MIKIYSHVDGRLLHIIYKGEFHSENRTDISPPEQFLQVSSLNLNKGKTFQAHKHIWKESYHNKVIAQESWCIISGAVKVYLYDIDDRLIFEEVLNPGDISITFQGGHNYEILEDNTKIYEYKTGPYEGVRRDKRFI